MIGVPRKHLLEFAFKYSAIASLLHSEKNYKHSNKTERISSKVRKKE